MGRKESIKQTNKQTNQGWLCLLFLKATEDRVHTRQGKVREI